MRHIGGQNRFACSGGAGDQRFFGVQGDGKACFLHFAPRFAASLLHNQVIVFHSEDVDVIVAKPFSNQMNHSLKKFIQSGGGGNFLPHLGADLYLTGSAFQRFLNLLFQLFAFGDVQKLPHRLRVSLRIFECGRTDLAISFFAVFAYNAKLVARGDIFALLPANVAIGNKLYALLSKHSAEIHTNQFFPFVAGYAAEFVVHIDKTIGVVQNEDAGLRVLHYRAEALLARLHLSFCLLALGNVFLDRYKVRHLS